MAKLIEIKLYYHGNELKGYGVEWNIEKETDKVIYAIRENENGSGGYKEKVKKSNLGIIEKRFGNCVSHLRYDCWCREEDFKKCSREIKIVFFEFIEQAEKDLKKIHEGIKQLEWTKPKG